VLIRQIPTSGLGYGPKSSLSGKGNCLSDSPPLARDVFYVGDDNDEVREFSGGTARRRPLSRFCSL
jgi:hypothetical protein